MERRSWVTPDVLGSGYESVTLPMHADDEGQVVATLVRRRPRAARRHAVLYLHGYNDYFFQDHLADFYSSKGITFYALDLRKYGRSLRPYQTPYFCRSLTDYFPEITWAVQAIHHEEGNIRLLLNGHSLGGLIAALWLDATGDQDLIDAIYLNSPLLDFGRPLIARLLLNSVIQPMGKWQPKAKLPGHPSSLPVRSLHRQYGGNWDFNQEWKSTSVPPLRAGWLAAVNQGVRRVHAGLSIDLPILVMCAMRGIRVREFSQELMRADSVLDPNSIARWSTSLGPHVTCIRIDGGVHDLALSETNVRVVAFHELNQWLHTYFLD